MDLQPPRPFAGSLSAYLQTPNLVGRSLKQKFKLACPFILLAGIRTQSRNTQNLRIVARPKGGHQRPVINMRFRMTFWGHADLVALLKLL